MHRLIRDHLEEVLAESPNHCDPQVVSHLGQCRECREEVDAMRVQTRLLRALKSSAEPRTGFYARVMERIEAQGSVSIWKVFSDSPFGNSVAVACMALVLLAGIFLYTSDFMPDQASAQSTVQFISGQLPDEDQSVPVLTPSGAPNRDAVLVNLVTYREQ
jgi:predicted anti-sigma-YlaC factor YlaD